MNESKKQPTTVFTSLKLQILELIIISNTSLYIVLWLYGLPRWHCLPMEVDAVTRVWSLDGNDPLEEGMATYSILAWRIPWTEEPGRLHSMESQRVGWGLKWLSTHECMITYHCKFPVWQGLLSCFSRIWLFATPWTIVHQYPLSMAFSRQEYKIGLPFPSPGELPHPGDQTGISCVSCIGKRFLPTGFPGGSVVESACQCRRPMLDPCVVGDPLEKNMATDSSILAWKIPRTEEPGRLEPMGLQRVRHKWL